MSSSDHATKSHKKKRHPTLSDFNCKKTENCEVLNESRTVPGTTPTLEAKFQELEKKLMGAVDQKLNEKLNEYENKAILVNRKSLSKKKNARVLYIPHEAIPTFEKFQEKADEPLKETLKKVLRAAEKYLELTGGGSKPN